MRRPDMDIDALVAELRARRIERYDYDPFMIAKLAQAEAEAPACDRIWLWLSLAMSCPRDPARSVRESMTTNPWEHDDPDVQALWRYITDPAQLPLLEERQQRERASNQRACEVLAEALAQARARIAGE